MNPRRFAATGAVRLVCATCLLLTAGAWGASSAWAQTQQDDLRLRILERRLENLGNDFDELRAVLELEGGSGNVVLRLARVEDMLRENAGAMEELSFQLQRLQQNAEAYQRDAVLRFQELEDRFAALEARATAGAEAAAETGLHFQELEDRLVALETSFATEAATRAETGLRLQELEKRIAELEIRGTAPEPLVISRPEDEERESLGVSSSVDFADGILSPIDETELPVDVVLAPVPAETDVAIEEALETEEAPVVEDVSAGDVEDDAAFPYENPFPDFSPEPEPEPSSDSSIERPVDVIPDASDENDAGNASDAGDTGNADDIDSEMRPKPLQVVAPEEQDAAATGEAGEEEAQALYQRSYALVERGDFAEDASLQEEAISGFQNLAESWPQHELAADALYWTGEIFYIREEYEAAAKAFVDAVKAYPSSPRAGDSMLKLGVTMRLLERPENACAVFDELLFTDRYGRPSESERRRIDLERRLAAC